MWMILLLAGVLVAAGTLVMLFLRRRTPPRRWIVFAAFAAAVCLCLAGIYGYLQDYYHAEPEALLSLNSTDAVKVARDGKKTFFDGPGDSTAVIFYPGGKVEAVSYAPLLFRLAEGGADCFLMEMPFRLAFFNMNAADTVPKSGYDTVIMMGHSLGSVAASSYAAKHPDEIDGIVLLAGYPSGQMPENMKLLSILGDRDGVINRKSYEKNRANWPADSTEKIIEGGNHAQFGAYGMQPGDETALISLDEQQKQTVSLILEWLRQMPAKAGQ